MDGTISIVGSIIRWPRVVKVGTIFDRKENNGRIIK